MTMRPLHDRVLVKRLEVGKVAILGLEIRVEGISELRDDSSIAVGNGRLLETGQRTVLDVAPGDRILFGKYSGSEVKLDRAEHLILREDEILAVLA